jgi:hypothetical protein
MRMKWNLTLGLVACLIGFTGMSESTPAGAGVMDPAPQESGHAHGPHETRTVIASVNANPTGHIRYELSVAPCRQKECPFQVRLLQGKTPLTSVNMDWVKASGVAAKETVDESSGAGDPLRPDTDQTAWSTGAEKENVSTVARGVRLTPDLTGLLIDRRAGFDVLKRHHDLFVVVNRKLLLAWSDADGAGPSWSTVALSTAGKDGSQDILSFRGFHSPSDTDPDRLNLRIYHWNSGQSKLVETQTPEEFAVIAGTYESASKARAVQNGHSCLNPFWVLRSDAFSTLTTGKFVLAAVTGRKELADKKVDEVRSFTTQLKISIISSPYHQPDE